MASPVNAALCALLATAFWSLLGYALTRHLLPRALAVGAAPVMGWAVHSAATLPIFFLIGFSPLAVVAIAALCVAASVATLKLAAKADADAAPIISGVDTLLVSGSTTPVPDIVALAATIGNTGTLAIANVNMDWKPSDQGTSTALEMEDFDTAIAELKRANIPFAADPFESPVCRTTPIRCSRPSRGNGMRFSMSSNVRQMPSAHSGRACLSY